MGRNEGIQPEIEGLCHDPARGGKEELGNAGERGRAAVARNIEGNSYEVDGWSINPRSTR